VRWPLLAAVNLVESSFGRLRNDSTAGAQGPMQFMPSTWATYGRGDVHDPHAAILAAARFLHAGGAPAHERAALYAYNPSQRYVTAVEAYARVMSDPRAFRELYAWQVFVRTTAGLRRLTGPRGG
jgi:membrane-bound lytic murein transglycosylase B